MFRAKFGESGYHKWYRPEFENNMHVIKMPRTVDVFGLQYSVTDYIEAADIILHHAYLNVRFSVFALPVHGVIERQRDDEFASAAKSADMIVPDGQPIRWTMNWLYNTGLKDRVYGPTLLHHVLKGSGSRKLRVFVYGGRTQEVLAEFVKRIEELYPNVVICGAYREEDINQHTLSIEDVNSARPNLIVVGLGCPRQEKWISQHQNDLTAAVMGVGAAISFFTGDQPSAPRWMQRYGLEWIFRLVKEPRRLWRRYLTTNSLFLLLIVKTSIKRLFGSSKQST